jgi:hypothetical protein
MSQTTIGTVCSRIRQAVKAVRQDSFLTDKAIYSIFKKYAALVVQRADAKGRLMPFSSIFETLDYVKLVECDYIEAGCMGIKSYRTFRRTDTPLPMFTEGKYGPMVRSITSLDGSVSFQLTNLDNYVLLSKQKNFKFNKEKYCWYLNDHLYFPNVDYPAIRVEGMFEEDISMYKCDYDTKCLPRQQQSLDIPDAMLADIEGQVLKEFGMTLSVASDSAHDNININR